MWLSYDQMTFMVTPCICFLTHTRPDTHILKLNLSLPVQDKHSPLQAWFRPNRVPQGLPTYTYHLTLPYNTGEAQTMVGLVQASLAPQGLPPHSPWPQPRVVCLSPAQHTTDLTFSLSASPTATLTPGLASPAGMDGSALLASPTGLTCSAGAEAQQGLLQVPSTCSPVGMWRYR